MSQSTARKTRQTAKRNGKPTAKPVIKKSETLRFHKVVVQPVGVYEVDGEAKAEIPIQARDVFPADLDEFPKMLRDSWSEIEAAVLAQLNGSQ